MRVRVCIFLVLVIVVCIDVVSAFVPDLQLQNNGCEIPAD